MEVDHMTTLREVKEIRNEWSEFVTRCHNADNECGRQMGMEKVKEVQEVVNALENHNVEFDDETGAAYMNE